MINKPWIEWVLLLAALLFGVTLAHCARADFERNPFYRGKTVPGSPGVPCCTKRDCTSLSAYRMVAGGHYEIWLPQGYWYRPDPKIIRKDVTPDGKAHACFIEYPGMNYAPNRVVVYCVWIPIMFM